MQNKQSQTKCNCLHGLNFLYTGNAVDAYAFTDTCVQRTWNQVDIESLDLSDIKHVDPKAES